LLDYEIELASCVASSPQEVSNYLISPQADMGLDWFQSPVAKKFFSAVAHIALEGGLTTFLGVMSHIDSDLGAFTSQEVEEVRQIWKSATKGAVDVSPLVKRIRTDTIRRRADSAIGNYQTNVNKEPVRVIDHLDVLGGRLAMLSNEGVDYDPNPKTHMNEPEMVMRGKWGNVVLDEMFSKKGKNTDTGGIPDYGFVIASMPSGAGKSTLGITMIAYAIAYNNVKTVIMSNELVRALYASPVKRALVSMYAGQISDKEIDDLMEDRLKIYAPSSDPKSRGISVDKFETMQRIIKWEKPQIAIMDSITNMAAPAYAGKMDDKKQHSIKANALRDLCLGSNVMMYCPGNMSDEHQTVLKGTNPDKLNAVMIYGSKEYENCSDWAFLGWRNHDNPGVMDVKRVKNRHGQSIGEKWALKFQPDGGYYQPYF